MNISYKWLKDYVDFDLTPDELSAALTSIGLETGGVEEVESIKGGLKGIVIGEVLTCVEHPNSDHLHITTVNLGDGEPVQIVCGAPNVAAGQKVVVATVGTTLYDGEEQFQIKKSKIRGVESLGMICAEDEIGVGTSHDGIIVLPADAVPGTAAAEYYNVTSDYVIEMDITPNRIDAASHYGAARDIAAYIKQHMGVSGNLRRPSVDAFKVDCPENDVTVSIENYTACPRYSGITIRGVKVSESPEWLKARLNAIGLRPINNIVDITNFLLHAMGQPLHSFDLAKVKGNKIIVRPAAANTKFVTLDGVERKLDERDLMICNEKEPMCIAGVFGGLDSGVTETTTDVFIESAYFHPTWIRKTARRQGLNTDASFRYERGIDPNNTVYVAKLAALMIKELAGGKICGDIIDIYPEPMQAFSVSLSYDKIHSLIGKIIPEATIKSILQSLEIEIVSENGGILNLLVPPYRVDVQRDVDVIEDILRIYGYNNVEINSTLHSSLSIKGNVDRNNDMQNLISEQLIGHGYNEILNNSLTAAAYYDSLTTFPRGRCVEIINPLSNDLSVMRQTLLFGGLESISHNINRKCADLRMFEFGNCYFYDSECDNTEKVLAPYSEESHLALWSTGNRYAMNWIQKSEKITIFDLKADVLNIFARLGIKENDLVITQEKSHLYSSMLRVVNRGGKQIGTIGIIAKNILKTFDIDTDVFYAELNWGLMMRMAIKAEVKYYALPKTQPVSRDLALLVDKTVSFDDIDKIVRGSERKLLKDVTLFDVYEGKNLEAGKKSYAINIILQDDEKTLNDKAIEAIMNKIIANLTKAGAKLR